MNKQTKIKELEAIKALVDQGLGRVEISRILGISGSTATRRIREVKGGSADVSSTMMEVVRDMLDDGADNYDIAKELKKMPVTIKGMVKRANMSYSPVDDWVKKAAKSGVLLSRLKSELGLTTVDKAVKVVQDNFPNHFVIKTKVSNGDTLITPVSDSKKEVEYLNIDTSKKPFKYYVSPDKNYMLIKVDDSYGDDKLVLPYLSDIHYGSEHHRADVFDSLINWISETPGMIALTAGDLVENITKLSAGRMDEQTLNANEQVSGICKKLASIAHLMPFSVEGNHEQRTERFSDFSMGRVIADMLKVPYFREYVVMDIHWRGTETRIYASHRFSKNSYSIANTEAAVLKLRQTMNYHCSAYFQGHNHTSFILPKESIELVPGRGFKHVRWHILNNGSTTKRTGGYSELFPPSAQDTVYLEIHESGKTEAKAIPIIGE